MISRNPYHRKPKKKIIKKLVGKDFNIFYNSILVKLKKEKPYAINVAYINNASKATVKKVFNKLFKENIITPSNIKIYRVNYEFIEKR